MIRYKATTAAKDPETGQLTYSGKTYGVRFDQGIAWFDDLTVDTKLGLTAAEIAFRMEKDFGYQVEKFNADGTPYAEPLVELNLDTAMPKATAKIPKGAPQ